MLDIIDKYILKLFLGYFLGSLLVLITLFVAIDTLSQFGNQSTTLINVVRYYLYAIPDVFYKLLPVACMVATLFTLGSLNKNSEMVALFSLGNSLARISAPILIAVGAITIVSFWMSDRVIPYTNNKKNYVWYVDIRQRPGMYSSIKNSKIWYRQKNVLFNIKLLDGEKKIAQGVSFYYFDDNWDLVQLITAKKAEIRSGEWDLDDGRVTLFTKDSSFPLRTDFKTKTIPVEEDIGNIQQSKKFSEIVTISELRQYIKKNKEAGLDTLSYEVDLQSKFGFALASFIMSFIGIPFSVTSNRSGGRMVGLSICIGVAFAYWGLLNISATLGRQGYLSPFVSAWVPNVLIAGLTLAFLLRLKK